MKNRNCPICLSSNYSFLHLQEFHNNTISLMRKYDIVSCNACGMLYANKLPSQEQFKKYYRDISKYEFKNHNGKVKNSYVEHFQKIKNFILQNISYRDKSIKILDIGCSTGSLLNEFKKEGFNNLLGIEPAESCRKVAKDLYNIEVVSKDLDNFDTEDKFDVVILSAVLEHLLCPQNAIKKIVYFLKLNGYIYIEVPDVDRFYKFVQSQYQQFSQEHINYFSKNSIINLLNQFGFEIVKMEQNENKITQTIDPDLFILAKWTNFRNYKIKKNKKGLRNIKKYIRKSEKLEKSIYSKLLRKIEDEDKIIVWGAGLHTQNLLKNKFFRKKILYFVDSNINYNNKKLYDLDIKLPEKIKEDIPILISSYGYENEIYNQIKNDLKLNNKIIKLYEKS